jgi:hypothetical protein
VSAFAESTISSLARELKPLLDPSNVLSEKQELLPVLRMAAMKR